MVRGIANLAADAADPEAGVPDLDTSPAPELLPKLRPRKDPVRRPQDAESHEGSCSPSDEDMDVDYVDEGMYTYSHTLIRASHCVCGWLFVVSHTHKYRDSYTRTYTHHTPSFLFLTSLLEDEERLADLEPVLPPLSEGLPTEPVDYRCDHYQMISKDHRTPGAYQSIYQP